MPEPRRVPVTSRDAGISPRIPSARPAGTVHPDLDQRVTAQVRATARLAIVACAAVVLLVGLPLGIFTWRPELPATRIAGLPVGAMVLVVVVPGLLFVVALLYIRLVERAELQRSEPAATESAPPDRLG